MAYADDESIEEQLDSATQEIVDDLDFSALEKALEEIDDFDLFGGKTFKNYVLGIIAGSEVEFSGIVDILLSGVRDSIRSLLAPLLSILLVVLLCSLFNNIRSGKLSGAGEVIYFVCFSVVVIIVASMSASLVASTKRGLERIQNQMNCIFPILITLMTMMGGVTSVKAYSPMLAALSGIISNVFIYVLLPLFSICLVLAFVGSLSGNSRLSKMQGFVTSLFKWIVSSAFALFMGIIAIKGITAGSSDGISIRATKFAIKNYIPLLGGYISDGFELFKAGGMIVKNATGFAGILLLLATVIAPIISIALLELGLKLLAGIIEPIGDKRSANLLYDIAKSLKLLVAIIVGAALMYFLTIFLITCSLSSIVG